MKALAVVVAVLCLGLILQYQKAKTLETKLQEAKAWSAQVEAEWNNCEEMYAERTKSCESLLKDEQPIMPSIADDLKIAGFHFMPSITDDLKAAILKHKVKKKARKNKRKPNRRKVDKKKCPC
jgi:hypothetical protein